MKYKSYDVVDLDVYDEKGSFICKLDTLQSASISIEGQEGRISVDDTSIDDELMKFIGEETSFKEISDFEKAISQKEEFTEITFNDCFCKKCKLIGHGFWRMEDDQEDKKVLFIVDEAEIRRDLEMSTLSRYISSSLSLFPWRFHFKSGGVNGAKGLKIRIQK